MYEEGKILIISGSSRKRGDGYKITEEFLKETNKGNSFHWEYLFLSDYEIKGCIGCRICNKKNESMCPHKDDLSLIVSKMKRAQGIIFTTPVYSIAVSSQMKVFIDRTNYLLHRPELIGKPTMVLSTTDLGGTKVVVTYLKHIVTSLGLRPVGTLGIRMGAYINNEKYREKTKKNIKSLSRKFARAMEEGDQPKPTIKQAVSFKLWQTRAMVEKEKNQYDYEYWDEKGWINSEYFYDTKIKLSAKILSKIVKKRMIPLMKEGFIRK